MKQDNIARTKSQLSKEELKATKMLRNKIVHKVWRHRPSELGIQFEDGTRLFVDAMASELELSITDGPMPS